MSNPVVNVDVFKKIASELFPPNSAPMSVWIKAESNSDGSVTIDWKIKGKIKLNFDGNKEEVKDQEETLQSAEKISEGKPEDFQDKLIQADQANKNDLGLALRIAFYWELGKSSSKPDIEKTRNDIRGLLKISQAGDKKEESRYWIELVEKVSGFLGHWEKLTGLKWAGDHSSWREGLLKIIGSFEGEFWKIDESLLSAPEFKGTDVLDLLFEGTGVKPVYGNRETHKGQVFQVIDEGYLRQLANRNLEPRWENNLVNTAGAKVIYEVVLPGLFQSKENRQSVYWSYFSDTQLVLKKVAI